MEIKAEASIGTKIKEAGRHSVVYGLGSVAQSAVGFVLLPILTGALTKDDFGVYSLILMASALSSAVFYLGMTSALPRSYFDYVSADDRRAVFTTAFIILALGAFTQIALGYFGGGLISRVLIGSDQYAGPIAWAFFGGAVSFINGYFFSYLRILRKSVTSVVFSLISLPGGIGLTLFLLSISPGDLSAPFEAIALSQLAITVIFIAWFGKEAFVFRVQKNELSRLLPFGIASVVASFGSVLLDLTDRVIIEHFMTLSDVGSYSAAFRIGTLINVIFITPFCQIWSPMMMEYRFHLNVKDLFSRIFSYFLIIGSVILVGASLFTADVLPFLIRSDVNAGLTKIVLLAMLGTLVYGTTNIVVAGLFYERKVFKLPYVYYTVAGVKVAINILIIPLFGIIGAAVSALVAYILIPTGVYSLARRYFAFNIDWKIIGLLGGACFLPFVYGLFFSFEFHLSTLLKVIWFVATVFFIYKKCLSADDKVSVVKSINILKGYIKPHV